MTTKHPIGNIRAHLTHEIARRGTMESFMIRGGLLADLLDELTAYREAELRAYAVAMFEPDEAREGAGRSSIKKSLRAEGKNFID